MQNPLFIFILILIFMRRQVIGEEREMKKPIPKIRAFGQRSIAPSVFNRTSVPVGKCASLSEFLDTKLNNSLLFKPINLEERPRPFTPLLRSKDLPHGFGMEKENNNGDAGLAITMLQQFKPQISELPTQDFTGTTASLEPLDQTAAEEVDNLASCSPLLCGDIILKDDKTSRKRKDPFQGMESMNGTGKPVIVFGDNSKASAPMERRSNNSSKRQRPTYNHYTNGSGWWDSDMEGIDSEEVGHSEVWEGVGSTTFGDIADWH